jgi:pyruvate/2-oxoglutarate dehydrogenase complex dihydrolipoamide dehydrogenase (E3) component
MKKGQGVYNVVVIGAGTAGLVTAAGTAGLGGRVALIERNLMGGDCLNFGCVPSKALISSARLIQQIRESEKWGLDRQLPQFAFEKVFERMRSRRAKIAPNDSQERFESLGVDVFHGEARFTSPHEVKVNGQKLRSRNFVLATGSRPAIPQIEGIDRVPYFTNETIFDELNEKPESMIVLGGGPIGCELGQAFQRLGVKVTILQSAAQILPVEDVDVGKFMMGRFEGDGIDIRLSAETKRIEKRDKKIAVQVVERQDRSATFVGDVLLIAAGRTPNFRALQLDAAGVECDEHGAKVNDYLQTSQPHIYAAGDITNPPAESRLVGRPLVHLHRSGSGARRSWRKGSKTKK